MRSFPRVPFKPEIKVFISPLVLASLISALLPEASVSRGIAVISFSTNFGNNIMIAEVPGHLRINVDTGTDTVLAQSFRLIWRFTNGNLVGPLYDTGASPTVRVTQHADSVYESIAWNLPTGLDVTVPDTTIGTLVDFGNQPVWDAPGTTFVFSFVPTDTGSFTIEDKVGGTPFQTEIQDNHGENLPIVWVDTTIRVIACSDAGLLSGDCNFDSVHNSADVISEVNFVFKAGPQPLPLPQIGDVNCSGSVTASDIIYLVNFVFKGGAAPCDVCSLF